jgi:VWFA-related protein
MMKHLFRSTTRAVLMMTAVAVAAQAPTEPPAQPPSTPQEGPNVTFKVEINYVEVDARVLDAEGRFVRDLSKEDFQLFEDGKPQTIDQFALVNIPVERAEVPLFAKAPIESDVSSNARDFNGRLYLFVLDDLHTAPLRTQLVRNAARRFIDTKLGANDMAAVISVRGTSDGMQGFTDNRRLLVQAVDRFIGQKLQSETLMRLNTLQPNESGTLAPAANDPSDLERGMDADASLRTLRNAAEFMAGVRGRRKALIYISEGIEYNVADFTRQASSRVAAAAQEAVASATRSNVTIYAIDPRGLTTLGDDDITVSSITPELNLQSMQRELQLAHDSLRTLADFTGGFAVVNTNDFATAFDRIVSDNSSYYLLGYYPANDRRDGRTRKIDVRIRRSGAQVFARKDYIEPRGRPPAVPPPAVAAGTSVALRDVINSPLPLSGLTMSTSAAAFKGAAPNASVSIVIEARGRDLNLKNENGKYIGNLELSVSAFDRAGKFKVGERPTVTFGLRPETYTRVNELGVRVLTRLQLPPGRYQLRVGGLSGEAGLRGSVFYELEIPDFSKEPFTMSGLLLTSPSASRVVTARPDPLLEGLLPGPPTTIRDFQVGEEIALFTEVYDNQLTPRHMVDITTNVLTDDGRVVFTASDTRSSDELDGKPGGYGYSARVPLKDLAPGLYVLKVEARTRLGNTEPISRQVQFRIR